MAYQFTGRQLAKALAGAVDLASTEQTQAANATWQFGYKSSIDSLTLTLFNSESARRSFIGFSLDGFEAPLFSGVPSAFVNRGKDDLTLNWGFGPLNPLAIDDLFMHPGFNGETSTARFIAQEAGTYELSGNFRDLDPYGGDGAVGAIDIIRNTAQGSGQKQTIWSEKWENGATRRAFNLKFKLAIGDSLDFSVEKGGGYDFDSTALKITKLGLLSPTNSEPTPPTADPITPKKNEPFLEKFIGKDWQGKTYQMAIPKDDSRGFAIGFIPETKIVDRADGKVIVKSVGNFDPSEATYVYIHGWQDGPKSDSSKAISQAFSKTYSTANTLIVDWKKLAQQVDLNNVTKEPSYEASVAKQVGETVAEALVKRGADLTKVSLIGHSLGSFVAGAAANHIKTKYKVKVKELVYLDTAATNPTLAEYDIDARNGYTRGGSDAPYDPTTRLALNTSSYTVVDGHKAALAGNNDRAAKAANAYLVNYSPLEFNLGDIAAVNTRYHNGTIGVYADLISKGIPKHDSYYKLKTRGRIASDGRLGSNKDQPFDGVVVATQPWRNNPEVHVVPKALGWATGYDDPLVYGSSKEDVLFFKGFNRESQSIRWLYAGEGDDIIGGNNGKGIDVLVGGKGRDKFFIGYTPSGKGKSVKPYLDKNWLNPFDSGINSYAVVYDFDRKKDKIRFAYGTRIKDFKALSSGDLDKSLSNAWGSGVGVSYKDDLVAYIRGITINQFNKAVSDKNIYEGSNIV